VLYVGKAADLRSRVRSYFHPGSGDERFFVARLDRELEDLETIVSRPTSARRSCSRTR